MMKFIFCLLFFFSFQTAFGGSVQVSFVEGDVAVFSLTNQEWIPVVNHAVLEESRLIQIKNGGRVSYFKTDSRNKSETLTINSNGTRRLTFSSKKLIFDDYELKEMPIVTGGNDIVDELPGLGFIEAWKRFVAVFVSPRKRQKVPAVGEELNVASLEYAKALGHIEVNKPYDSDHVLKFMRLPETMELSWVGIKQHKKPYGIYVWPTSEIRSSVQVRTSKNTASVAFSDWDSYYVQVASKDHQFVSRRIRVDVISDSRKNIFTNEKIVDRKVEIKNALWHIVSPPQNAYLNLGKPM